MSYIAIQSENVDSQQLKYFNPSQTEDVHLSTVNENKNTHRFQDLLEGGNFLAPAVQG